MNFQSLLDNLGFFCFFFLLFIWWNSVFKGQNSLVPWASLKRNLIVHEIKLIAFANLIWKTDKDNCLKCYQDFHLFFSRNSRRANVSSDGANVVTISKWRENHSKQKTTPNSKFCSLHSWRNWLSMLGRRKSKQRVECAPWALHFVDGMIGQQVKWWKTSRADV